MKKLGLLVTCLLALALPVGAAALTVTPIMSGLDNPRGLAFGPDGALYVVEGGRGGTGPCVVVMGAPECIGLTGAVSRLASLGQQQRIITGLPSLARTSGDEASGPSDISFRAGSAFVTLGLGTNPAQRALLPPYGRFLGHLVRLTLDGGRFDVADVSAWEAAANPDGGAVDSNPYGVLALSGKEIVTDAGGNDLLQVDGSGAVSTIAVFPARSSGRQTDSVPTAVTVGPDGAYYVSELSGAPFLPGAANIYRVVPGQTPTVFQRGLTDAIDLAFDSAGNLYVLEHSACGPFFCGPGDLLRISPAGARTTVVGGLDNPTAFAFAPGGSFVISNHGSSAGVGQVLWVQP